MSEMQLQTKVFDPIVFNDGRVEFLLPDDFYDSASMRIANLGMFAATIVKDSIINAYYPITCGVAQVISRFTVLSGSDELEMLDHVSQWATVKALNNSFTTPEDIQHNTLHNGWNFSNNQQPGGLSAEDVNLYSGRLTLFNKYVDYSTPGIGDGEPFVPDIANQSRLGNTQYPPGSSASLNVSMISGLLQATPILPMIPKLRLVIEYDTNVSHYFNNGEADSKVASLRPTFPVLIVKRYVNPPKIASVVTIPYTTVKCSSGFRVDAVTAPVGEAVGIITRNTFQSYDFVGKMLKRLTLYNSPQTSDAAMLQGIRSPGQSNEVINFIINGDKYLPDNGIDSPAMKLQYLVNSYGNFCIPLACAAYGLKAALNVFDDATVAANIVGNLSLTAVRVDSLIKNAIQVEYSRQPLVGATDVSVESLNILLFGELSQLLTVSAGRSSVSIAS